MSTDEFRMVFAGIGSQGGKHRIPAALTVAAETGLVVPAIVDPVIERAQAYLEQYRSSAFLADLRARGYNVSADAARMFCAARVFGRIEEALELGADAVTSVVPGAAKLVVGQAAAAAGADLHTDKPTAMTPEQARQLFDVMEAAGCYVQVGYHLTYMVDGVLELLLRAGYDVSEWQWLFYWTRANGIPDAPHFTDPETGGVTGDIGGHLLRLVKKLMGADPGEVLKATASYGAGSDRAETGMDALLAMPGDRRVRILADWQTGWGAGEQLGLQGLGPQGEELTARLHANRRDDDKPDTNAFVPVLRREDRGEPFVIGAPPPRYTDTMVAEHVDFATASRERRRSDRGVLVVEHRIADIRAMARPSA